MHHALPVLLAAAALLAGCASSTNRAPIETRTAPPTPAGRAAASAAAASAPDAAAAKPPPPSDNAGKPGYHTARPGDTLIRISLEYGQNWRDVARWNNLENPNLIEVGQVLRVLPPPAEAVATARPVPLPRVETRVLVPPAGTPGVAPPSAAASAVVVAAPAPAASAAAREPDEDMTWAWPAAGPVAAPFDESRNKGVAIAGKAGDPVFASADGRVVYAGSGLRGYGNLIIVKHNATYLSAYAHNQTLLVKEDQVVRRGQKIAEMGSSDADRVQLHFEIRRQGKPIDPSRLLPAR